MEIQIMRNLCRNFDFTAYYKATKPKVFKRGMEHVKRFDDKPSGKRALARRCVVQKGGSGLHKTDSRAGKNLRSRNTGHSPKRGLCESFQGSGAQLSLCLVEPGVLPFRHG